MTLKEKFERYHSANPNVYALIQRYARELLAAGRDRLSISLIVERVRWESSIKTTSEDQFKIANAHSAFYARKLDADFLEFKGKFKLNEQKYS